jgi:putative aldouronate transport system substrate-binding protein
MAEPTTSYIVASKECKNPEAAFKIINYLIENEQTWVDEGINSADGLGSSDFYPLYCVFDNADEIEFSYDCLKKYLAGEIGIDDVDYSTHKLLRSDMESITKLKNEPYDDFGIENWIRSWHHPSCQGCCALWLEADPLPKKVMCRFITALTAVRRQWIPNGQI